IEAFLYGGTENHEFGDEISRGVEIGSEGTFVNPTQEESRLSVSVCAIARADGRLEFYSLPSFTPLFWCSSFPVGYGHYENHLAKSSFTIIAFDEIVVDELCVG